ncbi:uncharacterized protein cd34 [Aulostomus maculatus]
MAASTRRMNGLWRGMVGLLVLSILFLSNEVMCQDDDSTPTPDDSAGSPDAADPDAAQGSVAPDASTVAAGGDAGDAAGNSPSGQTVSPNANNQDGGTSGTSWTTVPPGFRVDVDSAAAEVPEIVHVLKLAVPNVMCVGKEDIQESSAVKAVVEMNDCDATKRVIQENPAEWCYIENCDIKISQDGNNLLVASDYAEPSVLADALKSDHLKEKLGVSNVQTPSSSGSSVFVGILVSGLLAALAITVGYFKCQRKPSAKGPRLAEEAYPADQENQGNTLASVAPLNPPPETQEKPSVNGESPENKDQPPPTNGHSTTKTADTEL